MRKDSHKIIGIDGDYFSSRSNALAKDLSLMNTIGIIYGIDFLVEIAVSTSATIVTNNIADFRSGELRFPDLVIVTPQQFCDMYL